MKRHGFTLIEISIALGVIAILAGTFAPLVFQGKLRAELAKTEQEMTQIEEGLQVFYYEFGLFPDNDDGITALFQDSTLDTAIQDHWKGPYVSGDYYDLTHDNWGLAYIYDSVPKGEHRIFDGELLNIATDMVVLASGGPNRRLETETQLANVWHVDEENDDILHPISGHEQRYRFLENSTQKILRLTELAERVASIAAFSYLSSTSTATRDVGISQMVTTVPSAQATAIADACANSSSSIPFLGGGLDECPALALRSIGVVSDSDIRDPWGNIIRWSWILRRFYSIGPDRTAPFAGGLDTEGNLWGTY